LKQVLEPKLGKEETKAEGSGKESVLPKGFVDVNEATFDTHPGMFKKNSAKVLRSMTA
jgi:hypothetical protein